MLKNSSDIEIMHLFSGGQGIGLQEPARHFRVQGLGVEV